MNGSPHASGERADVALFALVAVAVGLAAFVVALGAYTRLADAGLGCPDWPGCYGGFGVPASAAEVARAEADYPDAPVDVAKAWTEMLHRYAATALGLVILAVLAMTLRAGAPWRLPAGLAALVVAQGIFGAWTVTLKLWPQVVTAHLLGGFATLALLWLLALRMRPAALCTARCHRLWAAAALAALLVQVALGGWLTSNYAALACADFFPTCHGAWWPEMNFAAGFNVVQDVGPNYLGGLMSSDARVAIHITHRLGAVAVALVVGALAVRLGKRPLAWWLGGTLAVQLGLGVGTVIFALPLPLAVLHNAGAAALLLALVTVNFAAWRRSES